MSVAGVLLVGSAIGDVTVDNDECRTVAYRLESTERLVDRLDVIGVADARNIPTVACEAGSNVFAEGQVGGPFNGDPVAVVDPAQVWELQVTRKRGGLTRDALHHVTVAAQDINVVVEHVEAGTVEMIAHPKTGEGHSHTIGHALSQRTRGRFDTRSPTILRMPGTSTVELPKGLDVFQGDRELVESFVLPIDRLDTS